MADLHTTYTIDLIADSDALRQDIVLREKDLKKLTEQAKSLDFTAALDTAKGLNEQIQGLVTSEQDASEELKAFGKAADKAYKALEDSAVKYNYSLSEAGKEQRARIAELRQERSALGSTADEKKKAKEIDKEIKALLKDVVELSDEELESAIQLNRQARAHLKTAQQQAKNYRYEEKHHKTMASLMKDDLKAIKDKIKAQLDFIQTLKTTEGRYAAMKKVAGAVGKGAVSVGKGALKAGGVVAGAAMALGGAAMASADNLVNRESEARRLKIGGSADEKQNLLGKLFIQTGADYTTIVDAVNRVATILGDSIKGEDLENAVTAELMMPGAAALFRQQNTGSVGSKDFVRYMNRMRAVQGATGASVEQITSSTEYISNLRQSSFSNATQTELQSLYLGLQGSGMFSTEEELQKAFDHFVRTQKNSKKDVFTLAKEWDWSRTAEGATNKTQSKNAMRLMNWGALETAAKTDSSSFERTDAEKTAMKMREIEEKKNQILAKVIEALVPVLEAIDVNQLSKVFDSLIKLITSLAPHVTKLVTFLTETLVTLIDMVAAMFEWLKSTDIGKFLLGEEGDTPSLENASGQPRANGGLVAMPSLCGEGGGAEMVVPLEHSRMGRGMQLTQQLTQYFSMSGNQTTTLSLAAAVNSREFAYQTGRLNTLSRRLGR